jgi:RNA polymerase sigma factor (sigma-70 family)
MATNDFQQILIDNRDYLKPFAFRLTGCEASASDLVQDTLLLAWKNKGKYNWGSNMKAWLFTIMRNSFINSYRRNKLRKHLEVKNTFSNTDNTTQYAVDNAATGIFEIKQLRKLLVAIPDSFRKPLELYAQGYKYSEIAVALVQSEGTIKSRIHFGRKLLKEQLYRQS